MANLTPDQRETLTAKINEWRDYASELDEHGHHTRAEAICDFAIELEEVLSALAPRGTCGTCQHWRRSWPNVAGSVTGECSNTRALPFAGFPSTHAAGEWHVQTTSDDGCIRGYAPREEK